MPSTVTIDLPTASPTSTRHEFTGTPSRRTEHEAHSPSLHPFLVPVSPRSSRSVSRSVWCGSVLTSRTLPLTSNLYWRSISDCTLSSTVAIDPSALYQRHRGPSSRLTDHAFGEDAHERAPISSRP